MPTLLADTLGSERGLISSDGGVLLLAGADQQIGLIDTLAAIIPNDRDPNQDHPHAERHSARASSRSAAVIRMPKDPAFKMALRSPAGER